jgi:sporulation protein YlmC with PRC-barrel domain
METTMKKRIAIATGLALSVSMALAQEQGTTEDYDPNRDIVTETERDRDMGMDTTRQDSPVQSEYGTEPQTPTDSNMRTDPYGTDQSQSQTDTPVETDTYSSQTEAGTSDRDESKDKAHNDVSQMSSDKLIGKSVVTVTGEEVGEIDEVGYSATHQERVAVIEAGGFLGVGEKRIAVPLSELEISEDGNVKTTMTRDSIEMQEEFDEAGFTADQSGETDQ